MNNFFVYSTHKHHNYPMVKIHPLIPIAIGVLAILIGSMFLVATTYAAPFPVAVGGTGQSTITGSQVLYGAGTSPIQTVATGTITCAGTASCTTTGLSILGGNLTITGSGGGTSPIATSTHEVNNDLALWTSSSATPATLGQVAASTNGFILALVNGVPTWVASSSINNGVTSITVPQGAFNGALTFGTTTKTTNGVTSSLTITGSVSTLTFSSDQSGTLTVGGGGTGAATLTGCLTGNGTGAITGSGTCNTSNATVSSIATTWPITGGTITTTGTITWGGIATSSNIVSAQALYATGVNTFASSANHTMTAVLDTMANASTTYLTADTYFRAPIFGATAPSNTASSSLVVNAYNNASSSVAIGDGTNTHNLFAVNQKGGIFASSTLAYFGAFGASGSTTLRLPPDLHGQTIRSIACNTDIGTAWVAFGTGSATTTAVQCSATGANTAITANNTFTGYQTVYIEIGHSASTPNSISASANVEETN